MFKTARTLKKTGAPVEVHADLVASEIDVCLASETWFNVETRSESIEIPNYTLQRVDRNPTSSAKTQKALAVA